MPELSELAISAPPPSYLFMTEEIRCETFDRDDADLLNQLKSRRESSALRRRSFMVKLLSIWERTKCRRTFLYTSLFLVLSLAVYRIGLFKPSPIVNQVQVEGNARG
jgi:hypothetical protein